MPTSRSSQSTASTSLSVHMKITKITQQVKRSDRYSVFVDEKYSFSLSESALLESHITKGQELDHAQVEDYKKLSTDDKLYARALRFAAMRPRTTWEMTTYLERKGGTPGLIEQTIIKLTNLGLLSDAQYAQSFVANRRLLRPTSRRKLQMELRKKRIPDSIIQEVIGSEAEHENDALKEVIIKKRRQLKYQDDTKLMQYLARQGFSYGDIKTALQQDDTL